MKLGIICEANTNSYYRAVFPMRALRRRGHEVLWPDEKGNVPLARLAGCDLVHCYRRMDRLSDLRELSKHGVAISFDNDDNYAASDFGETGKGLEGRRRNSKLAQMTVTAAKLADVTTTTCEPLAEYYRAAGVENVVVIGNRLEPGAFTDARRPNHDGVVIGWVAEREHGADLDSLPIASALATLLERSAELRVISVGLRLPLPADRYRHVEKVPFLELLATTATFDIGIAPLADNAFNRSRSDVKLKEYGSAGTPWLASPVGPYASLGEAEGGLLVGEEEWVARAGELIESARKRRRLAKRAASWAKAETIDRHVQLWESAFLDAIERAAGRSASHTRAQVPSASR